ncbi:hypothetical protein PUNSTDRAFT_46511 [Punctularia strigosozonata HHB-11173 SS5]|uniref:uncharacterized protein n=1 Tax=Punctularia strigosozonata (strain HHB-11173) TaxID=741275 RepID=UPI00044165C3|nr:uncharacterized protein PUNSTDRAFT_46511 [Punctularia strigosozonata HHB-11173 SS5]EIN06331.1 hypothetical protein PUNSTDRAFT_46511 [Punctularia strigosozonata HHB-11173 SS5]
MPSFTYLAVAILAALAASGSVHAHEPSQVPGCAWTCAPYDKNNYPLDQNSSGPVENTLICQYEDPTLTYNLCTFSSIDGSVINNRGGVCPDPTYRCTAQRRYKSEDNFTAVMRKKRAAGPAPPQTSRPDYLPGRAMGQMRI